MSGCCVGPHEGMPPKCPTNQGETKPVGRQTVEALVKPEVRTRLTNQSYYFCDAPNCDSVYVSALGDHLITKDQLIVRVGIKESEDPAPLCYCFAYDRQTIREEIQRKGTTDIPQVIARRVKAGECHCEVTNPQGSCCLGNIQKAIQEANWGWGEGEAGSMKFRSIRWMIKTALIYLAQRVP